MGNDQHAPKRPSFETNDRDAVLADAPGPALANAILAEMASHDLREPVHAIQGFVSILLSGKAGALTPLQREFIVSMFISSRRLERLINDVQVILTREHDFSILEDDIDLVDYLRSCSIELSAIYPDAGSRISIVVGAPSYNAAPWRISADPMRIEQIIVNMLENALRYADPESPIEVRLRSTRTRVLCVVENQAERLADEDTSRWLMPFHRGSGSGERAATGRGLGLTVADHLVRLHQGQFFLRRRGSKVVVGFCLPRPVVPSDVDRDCESFHDLA